MHSNRPLTGLTWGLLLLVAPCLAQAKATGRFFEVTCEGGDQQTAERALEVVEPVWPLVCAAFGTKAKPPEDKLRVHLYRDVAGYVAADQRLTGGKFGPNQAMSHWNSLSAHVAMQPPCDDRTLAKTGLPMQTKVMLAWEACHIVRFHLCPNFRSHPGWFHDGLAATTAQRVLRELHPEMGEQPFFTQRWWRVRRLVRDGDMPSVSALLSDQTQDLDMRDRYAARVAFFEFAAARHPDKMLTMAKAVRATGGGTGYARKVQKVADRLFGDTRDEFALEVERRQLAWDERIRSVWMLGNDWHQRAFANNNAIAFASQTIAGGAFRAKGQVLIHPGAARQMNFLFAQSDAGFYSLAFTAGTGWTLFDFRSKGNEWRVLGRGSEAGMKAGTFVPFEVVGKGSRLSIKLAGKSFKVELPRVLPEALQWGVGAQAGRGGPHGSSGIWRDVTVEAH